MLRVQNFNTICSRFSTGVLLDHHIVRKVEWNLGQNNINKAFAFLVQVYLHLYRAIFKGLCLIGRSISGLSTKLSNLAMGSPTRNLLIGCIENILNPPLSCTLWCNSGKMQWLSCRKLITLNLLLLFNRTVKL